jgi:hypothetical protein
MVPVLPTSATNEITPSATKLLITVAGISSCLNSLDSGNIQNHKGETVMILRQPLKALKEHTCCSCLTPIAEGADFIYECHTHTGINNYHPECAPTPANLSRMALWFDDNC